MKQRVTIADVAKAAGVSKQTVSRAINDKGEISNETKARILEVVNALGYRPNRMAQAMNTQRSYMVGLVIPDITNPFFPEVARGVQDAAFQVDYNVFLCNSMEVASAEVSETSTELRIYQSLIAQGVDGIVTFPQISAYELSAFADNFRPIVMLNHHINHPNVDSLQADLSRGADMAIGHLVSRGHSKIGMISNILGSSRPRRTEGFLRTIRRHGLSDERLIAGEPTLAGGYQATRQLLIDYPDTTALFAYNDMMGIGAIRACMDFGRNVPNDISIIGFDDIELASMYSPSLSTIRIDKYDMGQRALRRLVHLINNPSNPLPPESLKLELILRESTR